MNDLEKLADSWLDEQTVDLLPTAEDLAALLSRVQHERDEHWTRVLWDTMAGLVSTHPWLKGSVEEVVRRAKAQ